MLKLFLFVTLTFCFHDAILGIVCLPHLKSEEDDNVTKRLLHSFLVVNLLSGLVLSVSCACEKKKEDMPFGVVLSWRALETTEFKDKNNRVVDEATWRETGLADLYENIELRVKV
ncbi:hypothetical protein ACFLTP_10180 [Chloroflexota bacterium]